MVVRFVHTSDWQIGMTRHFLDEDAQSRFAQARRDAIRAMGDLVEEHDAGFLLVCGDVFDSNHLERRTVHRALEAMGDVPAPVYLLPGNHDPLNAGSIYDTPIFSDRCPDNVRLLRDTEPIEVADGVELIGAPWETKRPLADLASQAIEDLEEPDGLRVLAAHGQVDTLSPDPDDPGLIQVEHLEAEIEDGSLHYVALGDKHSTTRVGDGERIWFSGAPEPTDFGEPDPGNALLVTLDDEIEIEPLPIADWSFETEHQSMNGDQDLERFADWLDDHDDKERTILKISFEGTLNLQQKADLDSLIEEEEETFGSIQIWGRHNDLAVRPDEFDAELLNLSGFAEEAFERLQKKAQGAGEEAQQAEDALGILYRLQQGGSA